MARPKVSRIKTCEDIDQETRDTSIPATLLVARSTAIYSPQSKRCSYDGQSFDSKWEMYFYVFHKLIQCDNVIRNQTEFIWYFAPNGENRKFYYDFLVDGQPYEVKGIWRASDVQKQAQCPQVHFVGKEEIMPMIDKVRERFPNIDKDISLDGKKL